MTDRDALLAAILANPDEDTPRLVYADWLQENGEEDRAEFIRVQCRMAQMQAGARGWKGLLAREKKLRVKLFAHLDALGFANLTFRRGFVDTVECGLHHFRDHAAQLRSEDAPAYEWVYREDERDEAEYDAAEIEPYQAQAEVTAQVFARPELLRCVSLDLPCLGIASSGRLLESEQLKNLRRLNFPHSEAGPALHLISDRKFANLRWLDVSDSNSASGYAELDRFAHYPHLKNLEYLDFSSNRVRGDDLQSFSEAPGLPKLRHLNLAQNEFRPFDVSYFLFYNRSQRIPALEELDLSNSFQDFTDLSQAAEEPEEHERHLRPYFGRLKKLWLRNCGITDKGAQILAAYSGHVRLKLLDLRGNPISATEKRVLNRRFGKDTCVFDKGKR